MTGNRVEIYGYRTGNKINKNNTKWSVHQKKIEKYQLILTSHKSKMLNI